MPVDRTIGTQGRPLWTQKQKSRQVGSTMSRLPSPTRVRGGAQFLLLVRPCIYPHGLTYRLPYSAAAKKPAGWDEEEDGEWEPPRMPNPKCKKVGCGPWKPPTKANPNYKGEWRAPLIDNPNYKVSAVG